jgi:acetyl-CoA synthetase
MFLESDGDGERVANALASAAEAGIRLAVLKVGSSEAGAAAASAHTGALAGDQRVFRALVEEAGAWWADDVHELLELAKALSEPRARPSGTGGLAVLTCSGGDSGVAADEAARAGTILPPLAEPTREALAELLPRAATIGNPLDYTAMLWGDVERLRRMIVLVGADEAVDQLLLVYDHPHGLSPAAEESWQAVRAGIIAGAAETGAATLVASSLPDLIDPEAITELAGHGVPLVAGLATAIRCAQALRLLPADPTRLREIAAAAAARPEPSFSQNGWLAEAEAKEMLDGAGIPTPPGRLAPDANAAVRVAEELGWPAALKLSGAGIQHKSDVGGLALGLADAASVRLAFPRLAELAGATGSEVLVERMEPPGVEVLVAARSDAVVPALVLALGGVWTEALGDVAVVPLPASPGRVEAALRTLRGAPLLTGGRGHDPVDLGALSRVAAAAGDLLLSQGLELVELNPVIARPDGAVAVDALARRA